MNPEYDLGIPEAYAQAMADPGIPDELVAEIEEEPAPLVGLNTELVAEVTPLIASAVIALVVVELIKGLGLRDLLGNKGLFRREGKGPLIAGLRFEEEARATAYRWVLAGASLWASLTFGFSSAILNLTGTRLSVLEAVVYGMGSVSLAAHVLYSWRLTQALKVRVYRFLKVTDADVSTDDLPAVDDERPN